VTTPTSYALQGDAYYYCGARAPDALVELLRSRDGTLLADLGRDPVTAGPYCAAHGGRERAEAEAHRQWDYLAPDRVGNREQVQVAGRRCLSSPDAYLVVRMVPPERRPGLWRVRMTREQRDVVRSREPRASEMLRAVGLATGCVTTPDRGRADRLLSVARERWGLDLELTELAPTVHHHPRPWQSAIGVGAMLTDLGAHATREAALEAGRAAWAARVQSDVDAIREARGGTLDWGVPVAPLADPVVLEPREGESAWDAVERERRRAPVGIAVVSGVRSSGEAL